MKGSTLKQHKEVNTAGMDYSVLDSTAAYLAHEIRNPLSAAFLYCSILKDRMVGTPEGASVVEALEKTLGDMNHVVDQVLQLYRPKFAPESIVNLASLLQGLRLEYVSRFKAVSIILSVNGSPFVMGNEHGLRQVFRNLIINGIQSMPEGGELNIALVEIVQGRIRCEVCDTGAGIPEEQLENIFAPFYTTKRDGSGLGLAVVAQILRQHDADFGVRNTQKGAMFWFEVDRVRRES